MICCQGSIGSVSENLLVFKEGYFPMSNFWFFISIIYPEHNYTLQNKRETVLNVKYRVYILLALSTLCP